MMAWNWPRRWRLPFAPEHGAITRPSESARMEALRAELAAYDQRIRASQERVMANAPDPSAWDPVEDPAPEQFDGAWADRPNSVTASFGIGPDAIAVWPALGASGLIHKLEDGRPIEIEPGRFGLVVATPEGQVQRVATSGVVLVRWSGPLPLESGGPVYWSEYDCAFNGSGRGVLMTGWIAVGLERGEPYALAKVRIP